MNIKLITAFILSFIVLGVPSSQAAQRGPGRSAAVGRAVPRTGFAPRVIRPTIVGAVPYRPYYYRPRVGVGLYLGYPYRYPYGYYGYSGYYGYPYYPYSYAYGYGYGYPGYGYGGYGYPAAGYVGVAPGRPYGAVRITDAPRDAQVFVDGYYVGIVDDFDGVFQHLNLEAGPHRIEIRAPGAAPIAVDVNVEPGRTITYRAHLP